MQELIKSRNVRNVLFGAYVAALSVLIDVSINWLLPRFWFSGIIIIFVSVLAAYLITNFLLRQLVATRNRRIAIASTVLAVAVVGTVVIVSAELYLAKLQMEVLFR